MVRGGGLTIGTNKDLNKKLAGHIRAYNEHVRKRNRYRLPREQDHAAKTMVRELQHMRGICLDLGRAPPKACMTCDLIHEDGSKCGR